MASATCPTHATGVPMQEVQNAGQSWSEAVADAEKHVDERAEAQATAQEEQRPRSRGLLLAVASVALAASLAGNVWLLVQTPAPAEPVFEQENLLWSVVDAAEVVEDFRAENARLPSADEIAPELGEEVAYQLLGDRYVVAVVGPATTLSYDSSVALDDWIAGTTVPASGGPS